MFHLEDILRTSRPGNNFSENTEKTVLKRKRGSPNI